MHRIKHFLEALSRKSRNSTDSLACLSEQYGILISQEALSVPELQALGYCKLSGNDAARLTAVFQYIPQYIANVANSRAAGAAFKAATAGTYKVSLSNGLHLCNSKLTPGAYRGIGLSNATNQVAGSAELLANNAALSIPKAPQIALGIFNAAALITGQYYMAQINGKLTMLQDSVNRVEQYLEAEKRSKLVAAFQTLNSINTQMAFIMGNEQWVISETSELNHIKWTARETINLCCDLLEKEKASLKSEDNDKEIERKLGTIATRMIEYRYAAQLFSYATILDVKLHSVTDPDKLALDQAEIETVVKQFSNDYTDCKEVLTNYLHQNRALNDRGFLQGVVSDSTGAVVSVFNPEAGKQAAKVVDDLLSGQQKKMKAKYIGLLDQYMGILDDSSILEASVSTLSDYSRAVQAPIEFVCIGEDYYMKQVNGNDSDTHSPTMQ